MLIVLSGGSGVGKNTVIEGLLKKEEFALMPTYTTREKRPNESAGNPYFFISEKEFADKLKNGELYEHQRVHNHYYGASKILLKEKLAGGKILIKDIDVLGTQNLVKMASADTRILTIFLKVDSLDVLIERLKARGEKEIDLRLKRYNMEQEHAKNYDYIITNNVLGETINAVLQIVSAENEKLTPIYTIAPTENSVDKARSYAEALKNGQTLSPIKIAFNDNKMYIIEGHHRYLASLMTGMKIAKEVVNAASIKAVDQNYWNSIIEKL